METGGTMDGAVRLVEKQGGVVAGELCAPSRRGGRGSSGQ